MTIQSPEPGSRGPDRRLVRVAGGILLADGLLRLAGRRALDRRVPGAGSRFLGAAEAALGVVLLDRAPIDPESL